MTSLGRSCADLFWCSSTTFSFIQEEHLHHLHSVLTILDQHQLYAKQSKCVFGVQHLEYLGHVLSEHGVEPNPTKI